VRRASAAEAEAAGLRLEVAAARRAAVAAEHRAEEARAQAAAAAQRASAADAQAASTAAATRELQWPWQRTPSAGSRAEGASVSGDGLLAALAVLEALGASESRDQRAGPHPASSPASKEGAVCARALQRALASDALAAALAAAGSTDLFAGHSGGGSSGGGGDRGRRTSEGCGEDALESAAAAAVATLERVEVGLQTTISLVRAEKEARARRQLEVRGACAPVVAPLLWRRVAALGTAAANSLSLSLCARECIARVGKLPLWRALYL
jgi:hypothetical protein